MQMKEGYPLMMLLELIYKVSFNLRRGKIIIFLDWKHLLREINTESTKPSQYAKDCRAIKSWYDEIKKNL